MSKCGECKNLSTGSKYGYECSKKHHNIFDIDGEGCCKYYECEANKLKMRLLWDEEKGQLVCECGRLVNNMHIKVKETIDVHFYDVYDYGEEGVVEYRPQEECLDEELLVCDCGAEMLVDIYGGEGDEPMLKFVKQPNGFYLA